MNPFIQAKYHIKHNLPVVFLKFILKMHLPKNILNEEYIYNSRNHSIKYNVINNCIFIHIPKTGGSSVANSLFNIWPHLHFSSKEYLALYGKDFYNKAFKFCFIRNPWDRLYSTYCYLHKELGNEKDIQYGRKLLKGISSFEQFVKLIAIQRGFKHSNFLFYPQNHFIDNVDFIGRFENLEDDFHKVQVILNKQNQELLHLNKSNSENYKNQYDNQMIDIVYNVYKEDIKLFTYDF